jgi:5-bromo-4-chloroindolyl phosphate hydrolysis protein
MKLIEINNTIINPEKIAYIIQDVKENRIIVSFGFDFFYMHYESVMQLTDAYIELKKILDSYLIKE